MDEGFAERRKIINTHKIHVKQGKDKKLNFIVCGTSGHRPKIDVDLGMLHVIGYWETVLTDSVLLQEVWIPLNEISYVESLVYRHKW